MTGGGFKYIPADAVGLIAYTNNNPMEYLTDTDPIHLYDIEVLNSNEIRATHRVPNKPGRRSFLGAIVSADREVVYWVNDTNPLP